MFITKNHKKKLQRTSQLTKIIFGRQQNNENFDWHVRRLNGSFHRRLEWVFQNSFQFSFIKFPFRLQQNQIHEWRSFQRPQQIERSVLDLQRLHQPELLQPTRNFYIKSNCVWKMWQRTFFQATVACRIAVFNRFSCSCDHVFCVHQKIKV